MSRKGIALCSQNKVNDNKSKMAMYLTGVTDSLVRDWVDQNWIVKGCK